MLVTFNLKDFPHEATAPHGIQTIHPDTFLVQLFRQNPDMVIATLERETTAFRNPPRKVTQFLHALTVTVPTFAGLAADSFSDPPRSEPIP